MTQPANFLSIKWIVMFYLGLTLNDGILYITNSDVVFSHVNLFGFFELCSIEMKKIYKLAVKIFTKIIFLHT